MKVPMKDVFIAEAVRVLQDALSELVRRGAAVSGMSDHRSVVLADSSSMTNLRWLLRWFEGLQKEAKEAKHETG
jgi:hypothetical protein